MNFKYYLTFPIRVILSQDKVTKLNLPTLAEERLEEVLPYIKGQLLDIGCGDNLVVRAHKQGVGVDVFPWPNVDLVCDTTTLPFKNRSFESVTLMACLNHIPKPLRHQVLTDARRTMKLKGKLIITMINPIIGWTCHRLIATWDPDQTTRGIKHGEEWGLSHETVLSLASKAGFKLSKHHKFGFLGWNHLYVFVKR
jgi:2-polyprenyl-3-methyl-5-hydroxy-6-metoxy-1,4-benzoquinol methylase